MTPPLSLFQLLKEVANFQSPEEEQDAKRRWLQSVQNPEQWQEEDLEGSISDKIAAGGATGTQSPYQVYSPQDNDNLYWGSQKGQVHSMPKDQADQIRQDYPDPDNYDFETSDDNWYDRMHPEDDGNATVNPNVLGQDPEHEHGYNLGDEGQMPTLMVDRLPEPDRLRVEDLRARFSDKFEDEILSDDGTIWGLTNTNSEVPDQPIRLIDNPTSDTYKTNNGLKPKLNPNAENPKEDWADKISLQRMVNDYTNSMIRHGNLNVEDIEENLENHVFKSFKLIDKFFNKPKDVTSAEYDDLTSLVQTDGKTIFITLSNGNKITMHNNTLSKEVLKRFQEDPDMVYPDVTPPYIKSKRVLTPNKVLTNKVEDEVKNKYYDLVGTLGELLTGANNLLHKNPEKARNLMAQAAVYAQEKVDDVQQAIEVITNFGEIDLDLACKSIKEYSLFELMDRMDTDPNGWSTDGNPMNIGNVRELLGGVAYHLRKPIELSAQNNLQNVDYFREGDLAKGNFKKRDAVYVYNDIGLAQEDAANVYGMDTVGMEYPQIEVSQKQIATFKDPTGTGTNRGSVAQVNAGKVSFLNFIKSKDSTSFGNMIEFTRQSFERSQGRPMSPLVLKQMGTMFDTVFNLNSKYAEVQSSEDFFDQHKEFLIDRINNSSLGATQRKNRRKELESLDFDATAETKSGKTIWTDRNALQNYSMISSLVSMAHPQASNANSAALKRFIGLSVLVSTAIELNPDEQGQQHRGDIGMEISDNFLGKLYRTSQSLVHDPLIAGIIKNPNLVYIDKEDGRTISILDPENHARVAYSATFSAQSGMILQGKYSKNYLVGKAFTTLQ